MKRFLMFLSMFLAFQTALFTSTVALAAAASLQVNGLLSEPTSALAETTLLPVYPDGQSEFSAIGRTTTLRVKLLDVSGQPLKDVSIHWIDRNYPNTSDNYTSTDESGIAELALSKPVLGAGEDTLYKVSAECMNGAISCQISIRIYTGGEASTTLIPLETQGTKVSVKLVDSHNLPLPNCEIKWGGFDIIYGVNNKSVTNSDGVAFTNCIPLPGGYIDQTGTVYAAFMGDNIHDGSMCTTSFRDHYGFKLYGYVDPDFSYDASKSSLLKSGFSLEYLGASSYSSYSTKTDNNGYFMFGLFPGSSGVIKISKPNYLTRMIDASKFQSDTELSTLNNPFEMWAGDMLINGVQDGAINIADVIEIAKYFGSTSSDAKFNVAADFNADNVINMADVLIVAKHFNATSSDYLLK
ncbi:MAG: dockerin type I domain-containing protein [Bacillota bacterium]|nr:dockerin type I domain-containing protein [Bacillota bacterium]